MTWLYGNVYVCYWLLLVWYIIGWIFITLWCASMWILYRCGCIYVLMCIIIYHFNFILQHHAAILFLHLVIKQTDWTILKLKFPLNYYPVLIFVLYFIWMHIYGALNLSWMSPIDPGCPLYLLLIVGSMPWYVPNDSFLDKKSLEHWPGTYVHGTPWGAAASANLVAGVFPLSILLACN